MDKEQESIANEFSARIFEQWQKQVDEGKLIFVKPKYQYAEWLLQRGIVMLAAGTVGALIGIAIFLGLITAGFALLAAVATIIGVGFLALVWDFGDEFEQCARPVIVAPVGLAAAIAVIIYDMYSGGLVWEDMLTTAGWISGCAVLGIITGALVPTVYKRCWRKRALAMLQTMKEKFYSDKILRLKVTREYLSHTMMPDLEADLNTITANIKTEVQTERRRLDNQKAKVAVAMASPMLQEGSELWVRLNDVRQSIEDKLGAVEEFVDGKFQWKLRQTQSKMKHLEQTIKEMGAIDSMSSVMVDLENIMSEHLPGDSYQSMNTLSIEKQSVLIWEKFINNLHNIDSRIDTATAVGQEALAEHRQLASGSTPVYALTEG